MGSISRGFRLAKASWGVVKQDRELLVLPMISFFCSLLVMGVFALGAAGIGIPEQGQTISPALYVLGFVMYVVLAFVTIFFNAAVIGTAMKRLKGEDASLKDGIALARQHIGQDLRVGLDHRDRRHDPSNDPGARRASSAASWSV